LLLQCLAQQRRGHEPQALEPGQGPGSDREGLVAQIVDEPADFPCFRLGGGLQVAAQEGHGGRSVSPSPDPRPPPSRPLTPPSPPATVGPPPLEILPPRPRPPRSPPGRGQVPAQGRAVRAGGRQPPAVAAE